MSKVWSFKTARFEVALYIDQDPAYRYDGDDENAETQAKLDSGEYVAFDSHVSVTRVERLAERHCSLSNRSERYA